MPVYRLILTAISALAIALSIRADVVLEFSLLRTAHQGERETARDETQARAWIGHQRARLDTPRKATFILWAKENKLIVLNSREKTYLVFDLPINEEDYLDEDGLRIKKEILAEIDPAVRFQRLESLETIGSWPAHRYHIEITGSGDRIFYEGDFWISDRLPSDMSLYKELQRAIEPLGVFPGLWKHHILDLDGIVVQRTKVDKKGKMQFITRETLEAIREVEPERGRYEPPADYQRIEADSQLFAESTPAGPIPGAAPRR